MSDLAVPSWRARPERSSGTSWRMLAFAGGALGVVAVAGAVAWGLSRSSGPRTIPVIEPDNRPVKVRPENPGGLQVPNQDQLVLEPAAVRRAAERSTGANARLAEGPEAPALDQLRRQAAPPAPPAAQAPAADSASDAAPGPAPGPQASALVAPGLAPPVAAPATPAAPAPIAAPPVPATPVAAPPAAPAPAAAPVAIAPVAHGRAQVQLGALNSEESARAEWERLSRRIPELAGFQPRVTRFDRGEGQAPLYRLRAGNLSDAAAARALCDLVRARGGACTPIGG
ncbi:SPOR domain-containing protein [Siccirubricoccus phaeus]|uniref:SPOR domain-containing protein n=1 Tax=Siccirubricoccus phaeus TaxID=2595053 RepID=UPI00165BBE1F|nr:SPOR domain-containing protein [Siccirubricoccus phaeus]